MQKTLLIISFSLIFSLSLSAQSPNKKSHSAFGFGSEAIILLDSGYSKYNDKFELIFTHTTRIEILNQSGLNWAKVMIPHTEKDSLVFIKGRTFNLNEKKILTSDSLEASQVDKKIINGIVENYFELPNAKAGSIIEYSYQIKIADWKDLNTWYFQNDIPVLKSRYTTEVPNYLLYYKYLEGVRSLDGFERRTVKKMIANKRTDVLIEDFQMDSVPAFLVEEDVPGSDYFISKLKFKLAEYTLPEKQTEFVLPQNYEELAINWAGSSYFKEVSTPSSYLRQDIEKIFHPKLPSGDAIKGFFYFVRNNFSVDLSATNKSLKEVYINRKGTPQQINMILAKLLNQSGFEAYLVALSSLSNRPTYPENPYFELFDTFVCMVRHNGQNYFLDASDKNLLFNMLPPEYINTAGLVISKDAAGFASLQFNFSDAEHVVGEFEISDSATIYGSYQKKLKGYAVYSFDSRFRNSTRSYNDYLIETIFENMEWNIKKHEVNDAFEGNKYLTEDLTFVRPVDSVANNYMEVLPIIFNEFSISPLQSHTRQNPLTLYTPLKRSGSYTYTIPKGWSILESPSNKSHSLENENGTFLYRCTQIGNTIKIEYTIDCDQVVFMPEEYSMIKDFMKEITSGLNQKIVLVK